ncbi:MAG: GtrA family protein [Gammaproteobacteria bacterium]|nr:GtrA family protein [Gammaproteobacteria bacterium]
MALIARWRSRLAHPTLGQGLRMVGLSGISFVLGFALTWLLVELGGLPPEAAYAIAVATCTVVNFFGFRHWVFRTAHLPAWPEARRFFPSFLGFRVVEVGLFHLVYKAIGEYQSSYVVTQALAALMKFAVAKWLVFKRTGHGPRT